MGQTAPRGVKPEELEGGQGVTVAHVPEGRDDIEVQEPVFGSPIDSESRFFLRPLFYVPSLFLLSLPQAPSYMCSMSNAADVMKSGIESLNILAGLQEDKMEKGEWHSHSLLLPSPCKSSVVQ